MSAEATYRNCGDEVDVTAGSARTAGEVAVAPDGRAGVYPIDYASGVKSALETEGIWRVAKQSSIVMLAGQEVFWDATNNYATYWLTSGVGFFLGTVQKDSASATTTVDVRINQRAQCVFRADRDAGRSEIVETTAGSLKLLHSGGSTSVKFGLAAEAQKGDLISVRSVPVASKWIWQGVGAIVADADADVGDVSFGMADATHASDADSITTSAFFHINMSGADLNIYGESDNAAAEVSATDTTKDFVVGTPFHLMIDGRSGDGSALAYYVNGVRVLSSTAFTVAGATGPLKALFHVEKSSNDSPGTVALDDMKLWLQDDAAA